MKFEMAGATAADRLTITALRTRKNLAKMHGGQGGSFTKIAKMAFGTGGCDDKSTPKPPNPDADPLDLFKKIGEKPISDVSIDPTGVNVSYQVILTKADFNDVDINECALIDTTGDVVAMSTFVGKHKSADVEMTFKWVEKF